VVSFGLCVPTTILGQEGQRTLKLEEQITLMFDELRGPVYRYLLCLSAILPKRTRSYRKRFYAFIAPQRWGREDNLRGWVFRVAHNIGINEFKKRNRLSSIAPGEFAKVEASTTDPRPSPEELLLRRRRWLAFTLRSPLFLNNRGNACIYAPRVFAIAKSPRSLR